MRSYLQKIIDKYPNLKPVDLDKISKKWEFIYLQSGTVHEIGHILGFTHEFIREKFEDFNNFDLSYNSRGHTEISDLHLVFARLAIVAGLPELINAKPALIGDYDFFSTMEYMQLRNYTIIAGLLVYCDKINDEKLCNHNYLKYYAPFLYNEGSYLSKGDKINFEYIYFKKQNSGIFESTKTETLIEYLSTKKENPYVYNYVEPEGIVEWLKLVHAWDKNIVENY